MTSITERPQRLEPAVVTDRRRGLTLAVWILAIAVAALAAWVIYDGVVESRTAVTGEIEALLDDYDAAWNEHDGEAFLALVATDYEFLVDGEATDATMQSRYINGLLASMEWQVETVGEPMMTGEGPWYVAQANHTTDIGNTDGSDGVSVFTIVEVDGTLLVRSHQWIGP